MKKINIEKNEKIYIYIFYKKAWPSLDKLQAQSNGGFKLGHGASPPPPSCSFLL